MISHRNVIANTLQIKTQEESYRTNSGTRPPIKEISLGLLPQSHIYALVVICHSGAYRGDQTIVLPKFELQSYLKSIAHFKITSLFLVSQLQPQNERNLTEPGAPNHHPHVEQPQGMLSIRSQLRQDIVHRSRTTRCGDRQRLPEAIPQRWHPTGIRYASQLSRPNQ